jgi:hypothetical protein
MFVTVDWRTVTSCWISKYFMIYMYTKLHIPSYNNSLVTAGKPKLDTSSRRHSCVITHKVYV